jgi:di/tricarboxylate transporter
MTPDAWITVGVLALVVAGLVSNRIGIDVVMAGGLSLLLLLDVVQIKQVAAGFGSSAVLMLGGLFVVAAGLEHTGAIRLAASKVLGRPKSIPIAQIRLMGPVALFSGFMNNTPIVAIGIPIVRDWARRIRISPSHLFMPLSFAAILGGKLTLIGTASNLIVMEEYLAWLQGTPAGEASLSPVWVFFGVAAIGLPCCIVGVLFIALTSKWLLPTRLPPEDLEQDGRQYRTEVVVGEGSSVVGRTIEHADLRNLPGLYLSEIERNGTILPAVGPDEVLQAGDRLAFVGALESVIDLRRIKGLELDDQQARKLPVNATQRRLVEAVVSSNSPLVGRSVRGSKFRTRYNGVIVAVHRQGKQVEGKIGDIVLRPGDTLLLETHHNFVQAWKSSDEFFLVSEVEHERPARHNRAKLSLAILVLMSVLLAVGIVDRVAAVWICALAMILTRCVTGTEARQAINWQVLVVVAASLGIASAVASTGLAGHAVGLVSPGPETSLGVLLFVVFLAAAAASQLVTPYAAAILLFPFTMEMAAMAQVDTVPFMFVLMVGAGCAFINPVGYQTNLMVYGPGGYRMLDFARMGIPLTILLGLTVASLAPLVYL